MFMMPPTRRLVKTAWEWTICCSTHRQQCWTSWRLFDQVLFERPLRREGFIGFWRGNGIRKGGERGEWAEKERESVGLPRKGRLPLLESTSCRSRSAQPIGPLHSKFEQPANQNPPFESYVPRTTWNREFHVSQYTHITRSALKRMIFARQPSIQPHETWLPKTPLQLEYFI